VVGNNIGFVINFLLFPVVKNFENRLRFDKVAAMSLVAPVDTVLKGLLKDDVVRLT